MLQENTIEVSGAPTWGSANDWRVVDGALRAIARRRAGLDAEEARWLREAEAMQIWRPLGMVNALDYLERVLGYAPRAGQERLRVARALGDLPVLERALAESELAYSAVRELSRVATRATEAAWARAAAGKNLRQIEELVAGHAPGGFPDDPPDPEVRTRVVRFELSPETFARLRQVQAALDDEHGAKMTDDELVADTPERATQDVPPATVRFVLRRDGGRCRVPGCRSARGLEVHHIIHRADGGGHEPANLVTLCSACHQAHHDGRLLISGTADALEVERPGEASTRAHMGAHEPCGDSSSMDAHVGTHPHRAEAILALTTMGWKPAVAQRAVDETCAALAPDAPLDRLVFESLRRCPH